jgi:hypothetical protein
MPADISHHSSMMTDVEIIEQLRAENAELRRMLVEAHAQYRRDIQGLIASFQRVKEAAQPFLRKALADGPQSVEEPPCSLH